MSQPAVRRRSPTSSRRPGFVLVTAMLFLVILTLLGLSLFRSSGLLDRISANTRDRQRAFESAESALQFAEYWLISPSGGGGGAACTSLVSSVPATNIHVCTNGLTNWATLPWSGGFTYTPLNQNDGGGTGSAVGMVGNDVYYYDKPGFYIEYEGLDPSDPSNTAQIYQLTAYGYGGNADTQSVVRSTYRVTPAIINRGAL